MHRCDVLVIGGGIVGVSVACELAADRTVCLVEMESTLAFHTTGRSAATFLESYGGPLIRRLTISSRAFFDNPPDDFDSPLMTPRPLLWLGPVGAAGEIRALEAEVKPLVPSVRLVEPDEALAINPILRPGYLELGMLEPGAMELDVSALHQGFVRGLRRRNGEINTSAGVVGLDSAGPLWRATVASGDTYEAPVVVNAAGAWGDEVATHAGAEPIGLHPLRRTLFTVSAPEGMQVDALPLTADVGGTFYIKPEGEQYLCSPADETPSPPCDAKVDEIDIARAIDRIAPRPFSRRATFARRGPGCVRSPPTVRPLPASIRGGRASSGSSVRAVMASRPRPRSPESLPRWCAATTFRPTSPAAVSRPRICTSTVSAGAPNSPATDSYDTPASRASNCADGIDRGATRAATASRVTAQSISLTGVSMPCVRPSSTISPLSQSTSVVTAPAHEALPCRSAATFAALDASEREQALAALAILLGVDPGNAGRPVALDRLGTGVTDEVDAVLAVGNQRVDRVHQVVQQLAVLGGHDVGVGPAVEAAVAERRGQLLGARAPARAGICPDRGCRCGACRWHPPRQVRGTPPEGSRKCRTR